MRGASETLKAYSPWPHTQHRALCVPVHSVRRMGRRPQQSLLDQSALSQLKLPATALQDPKTEVVSLSVVELTTELYVQDLARPSLRPP